jgi:hypothetical protein
MGMWLGELGKSTCLLDAWIKFVHPTQRLEMHRHFHWWVFHFHLIKGQ